MRKVAAHWAWLAVVALWSTDCLADTVTLDNGDHLTGTIARLENGKLVINTSYAGDVKIDLGHIRNLQSDGPMTVVLGNDQRLYGKLSGDGTQLTVQPNDQSAPKQAPTAQVSDILPGIVTGQEWRKSGRINIGWSDSTGNTNVGRLHVDAETIAQQGKNRYTAGITLNHATDQSVETESNTLIYLKHDRFFSPKWYTYSHATFENDKFTDIQLRTTVGLGSGWQAIASSRTNLSLEGGLDYVYTDFFSVPTEQFPAMRLAVKFDHYLLPDKLQFFFKTEDYANLEDVKKSFARTQTGLRMPLRGNLVATAEYDVNWNGDPPPGNVTTDRTVLFTLGYKW